MTIKIGQSVVDGLNSARFLNAVSSPNTARNMVSVLILTNGILRAGASELDKEEPPSARHYGAVVEGMHHGFALFLQYTAIPLMGIGGLLLGKHLMAKTAFKNIGEKVKLSDEQLEFLDKYGKQAKKSIFGFFSRVNRKFNDWMGTHEVNEGLTLIHRHNEAVFKNVRQAVDGGKQIVIRKKGKLYSIKKDPIEGITTKGRRDNIMDALEGKDDGILTEIKSGKVPKNAFETTTLKFIDDDLATHHNVIGSQKLGEAIGMTAALNTVSPLITNKFVPPLLERMGLSKDGEETGKPAGFSTKLKPNFGITRRLEQQGFGFNNI